MGKWKVRSTVGHQVRRGEAGQDDKEKTLQVLFTLLKLGPIKV